MVIAGEPQKRLRQVLQRNFTLNACNHVQMAPVAISDRPGPAKLHLNAGFNSGASGLIRQTRYPLRREKVTCLTLEELFAQRGISACDLLKIDVEGWEYEAVLGSPAVFQTARVNAVALEFHSHLLSRRGRDESAITEFLRQCGYVRWPDSANMVFVRPAAR